MMDLYLNGHFLPLDQGRVPVEDRGYQFGDGVYEVVRVYSGRPFRMERHLDRLERSLAGLEIPLPEPRVRIEEVCRRLTAKLREGSLYLQVTRGVAPRSHAFPARARPTFLAYVRPSPPIPPGQRLKVLSLRDERWGRCDLKTLNLLPNVLARQRALRAGCDEALFVREDGVVTEGASSNAFMVRCGAIFTHPPGPRILGGVTREAVIQLARELAIPVLEQTFTLTEAREADEFFMTGTSTEVGAVVSIDGRKIGRGRIGPVVRKLTRAFRELVKRECD